MMMYHGPGGRGPGSRRARQEAAGRVGLTDRTNGTNHAQPQLPAGGPSFRPSALWASTRTTWHGFRRVLGLVWEANAPLTASLALLNLVQGAVPAARVWLSKLLVDAVVGAVTSGSGTAALPQVVLLVALQFGLGAASNIAGTVANICQQLLQEQ